MANFPRLILPRNIIKFIKTSVFGNVKTYAGPGNEGIDLIDYINEAIDEGLINNGGGGGGNTDLSVSNITSTNITVESSTGDDAILPPSSATTAGLQTASDKIKLNFITVTNNINLDNLNQQVVALISLSGVPATATDLGVFPGTIINDNSTIKQALAALEQAIQNTQGYSENGVLGNGATDNRYRLGGTLNQNTNIGGAFLYELTFDNLSRFRVEVDNNNASSAKSILDLTNNLIVGASLRSEINNNTNQYAEVRVDPDDTLTSIQRVTNTLRAGFYAPSNQNAYIGVTDGEYLKTFRTTQIGHFAEGIKSGSTSKVMYINPITKELLEGDVPGGGAAPIQKYSAGNGAIVTATGSGISFNKTNGIGTFTVPPGVQLISARINGVTADLAPDNSFSIVTPTSLLDDFPTVTKINRITGASPSPTTPYTYDLDNAPLIQTTNSTSSSITTRVINLNTFSNWALKLNF